MNTNMITKTRKINYSIVSNPKFKRWKARKQSILQTLFAIDMQLQNQPKILDRCLTRKDIKETDEVQIEAGQS